ncbi:MAG: signal peptidase I [Lachnospiraceae bacterium]|nr:signal peptidase I [Lachnospiraceae bacterium]
MEEETRVLIPDEKEEVKTLTPEEKKEKKKQEREKNIKSALYFMMYLLGIFLAAYLIINYVAQRTIVIGDSMNETLHDEDNLIVDKITYRFRDPKRFEIIVFPYEQEENTLYIKRIIGLPNETVYIDESGNIYINDVLLIENYGKETIISPGLAANPITLGPDEYFVLGDNRNCSRDSRYEDVGLISFDKIEGRAIFRIFPFNKFGKIKNGNAEED